MKELNIIQTKLKAPKGHTNEFGKYMYRKAEDILEAVKPLLEETKCTVTITDELRLFGTPHITERSVREYDNKTRQWVEYRQTVDLGTRYFIIATATITNESGESVSTQGWAELETEKKGMDAAQLTGSTSSYARKYALNGLFAIDDNKDPDDLNNGHQGGTPKTAPIDPKVMNTAVAEARAATTQEALNAVWGKYYTSYVQMCQPGTPFYTAVCEMSNKFKAAAASATTEPKPQKK